MRRTGKLPVILFAGAAIQLAMPAAAQDSDTTTAEEAIETSRESFSILLPEGDQCEDDSTDPDVIVVCRETFDAEQFMSVIPREVSPDDNIPNAPNVDGRGLPPAHGITFRGCILPPCPQPPAYMVDFDALPETPAGSEAARLYGGPTDADSAVEKAEETPDEPDVIHERRADDVYGPS